MTLPVTGVDRVPYSDPWNLDLHERIRTLARGQVRVAYFYERSDSSTFRYRVYNMVQVLNSEGNHTSASHFFLEDYDQFTRIADVADLLVICRTRYSQRVNRLISAFQRHRKKVLFDVDDLVFNTDYCHLILCTLDENLRSSATWDFWYAYIGRIGTTLKLCDGAVATTDYLAERIREFAAVPVTVIPNFMNREQLEISLRVLNARRAQGSRRDAPIRLGYFSGSPSHNRDLGLIDEVLSGLLMKDDRLRLVLTGHTSHRDLVRRFASRVEQYPLQDFVNLQRLIGMVQFNLVPLQHNVFTNCKSELKYFEAAAVGTLSIVSPTHAYRRVRDGYNGYVAQAHQWEQCIARALAGMDDYDVMAGRARDDAMDGYAWYNQRARILAALGLE